MSVEKIYTADEIFNLNKTDQIISSKAKDIESNFYHYTTISNVDKILSGDDKGNRFIFASNLLQMNDRNEAERHKLNGDKIHSFCLCCTKHEKIPLWYLYSGICGNGARLGFTPGKMLKFISNIDCVYPVKNGKVDYGIPLKKNVDFELQCGWVYYLMDGNNRIKYKNKFYAVEIISNDVLEDNLFVKDYPWEYEREFRIVIKNNTEIVYKRLAIPMLIDLIPSLEIMCAPEYEFNEIEKEKYISYGIKREKIKKSALKIHMDLLHNNKLDISSNIDKWCDDQQCEHICNYVKTRNQCQGGKLK